MKRYVLFGGWSDPVGSPPPDPLPDNDWANMRGSYDTTKLAAVAATAQNLSWKRVVDSHTGLPAD